MKSGVEKDELPDNVYLAFGGEDTNIYIMDIKRRKIGTLLKGHSGTILDLVAHPKDPRLLLSVSKDGTIRLWNIHAKENSCLHCLKITHPTTAVKNGFV